MRPTQKGAPIWPTGATPAQKDQHPSPQGQGGGCTHTAQAECISTGWVHLAMLQVEDAGDQVIIIITHCCAGCIWRCCRWMQVARSSSHSCSTTAIASSSSSGTAGMQASSAPSCQVGGLSAAALTQQPKGWAACTSRQPVPGINRLHMLHRGLALVSVKLSMLSSAQQWEKALQVSWELVVPKGDPSHLLLPISCGLIVTSRSWPHFFLLPCLSIIIWHWAWGGRHYRGGGAGLGAALW